MKEVTRGKVDYTLKVSTMDQVACSSPGGPDCAALRRGKPATFDSPDIGENFRTDGLMNLYRSRVTFLSAVADHSAPSGSPGRSRE